MKTRLLSAIGLFALTLLLLVSPASADHFVFPSTNDANQAKGWAYFTADTSVAGQATLTFTSTRSFNSCFEYRSETSVSVGDNFNPQAHGLYAYECVNNSTISVVVQANQWVEVRMVFGAEGDERFDWTRVDVAPGNPGTKAECMNGGWKAMGFSNQGQCIRYVNTGVDSREP